MMVLYSSLTVRLIVSSHFPLLFFAHATGVLHICTLTYQYIIYINEQDINPRLSDSSFCYYWYTKSVIEASPSPSSSSQQRTRTPATNHPSTPLQHPTARLGCSPTLPPFRLLARVQGDAVSGETPMSPSISSRSRRTCEEGGGRKKERGNLY